MNNFKFSVSPERAIYRDRTDTSNTQSNNNSTTARHRKEAISITSTNTTTKPTKVRQESDTEHNMRPETLLYQLPLQEIGSETMEMIVRHNTRQNMLPSTMDSQSGSIRIESSQHKVHFTSAMPQPIQTHKMTDNSKVASATNDSHLEQISTEFKREIEKLQLDFAVPTTDLQSSQPKSVRQEPRRRMSLSPLSYNNTVRAGGSPLSEEIIVIDDEDEDDDIQIISERRVPLWPPGLRNTCNDLSSYNAQPCFPASIFETRRAISNELRNWNVRTASITPVSPLGVPRPRVSIQRESLSDLSRRIDENLAANGGHDSTFEDISEIEELSTTLLDSYEGLPALRIPTNTQNGDDALTEQGGVLTPISAVGPLRLAGSNNVINTDVNVKAKTFSNNDNNISQTRPTASAAHFILAHSSSSRGRRNFESGPRLPSLNDNSLQYQYEPVTRSSSGYSSVYPTSSRYSSIGAQSGLSPAITLPPPTRASSGNYFGTWKLPSTATSRTIESQMLDGSTLYSREGLDSYGRSVISSITSRTNVNGPQLPALPLTPSTTSVSISSDSVDTPSTDDTGRLKNNSTPDCDINNDCNSSTEAATIFSACETTLDPLRKSLKGPQVCVITPGQQFEDSQEFQSQLMEELGPAYLDYMYQISSGVGVSSGPVTPEKLSSRRTGQRSCSGESDKEDRCSANLFENFDEGSVITGSPPSVSFEKGVSHVSSPFKVIDGIKDAVLNRYIMGPSFDREGDGNNEDRSEEFRGSAKSRNQSFKEIFEVSETPSGKSRRSSDTFIHDDNDDIVSAQEEKEQQHQQQDKLDIECNAVANRPKELPHPIGRDNGENDDEIELVEENTSTSIQPSLIPGIPASSLPDEGALFLSINGIKDLGLSNIAEHNAEFSLEIMSENKVIKTLNHLVSKDGALTLSEELNVKLHSEFRNNWSIEFLLKCYYERDTGTQEVEIMERIPVKQRFPFMKKKYTFKSTFVTQPKPPDPWDRVIEPDGSYGQATISLDSAALSKYENRSTPITMNLRGTSPQNSDAHNVGVIDMRLLWIPRNDAEETIPTTPRDVERVAEKYRYQKSITKEGYLMQEGADHPDDPCRRYFTLNGTQLIGCNEVTLAPEIEINLLQAENVIYGGSVSGESGKRNFTNFTNLILLGSNIKLVFRDGEIINLYVELQEVEKNDWFLKLREVVHLNAYHQPWVKKYVALSAK